MEAFRVAAEGRTMSQAATEEDAGGELDTVTRAYFGRPDAEMNAIGWLVFLGLVVVILPLVPFILVAIVVSRLLDNLREEGPEQG
jgi:hypothetical protein